MDVSLRLPDLLMPLSILYIDVKLIVTIITNNSGEKRLELNRNYSYSSVLIISLII